MAVECVIKNAAKSVGEGPHWDDVTNTLLYVDHQENAIHRYCPESKENSTIHLGKNLDELYVTSSAHEVSPEELKKYPLSQLGVKGRKAHVYEGEIRALNKKA